MNLRFFALLLLLLASVCAQDAAALGAKLPACAAVVESEGKFFVQAPNATRFEVQSVTEQGEPVVLAGGRAVRVSAELLSAPASAALDQLEALLQVARRNGVDGAVLLRAVPLIGVHLSDKTAWVLPEGVARKRSGAEPAQRTELAAAAQQLAGKLERADTTPGGRQAVAQLLAMLDKDTAEDSFLKPAFARRLVRGGWLRSIPKLNAEAARVEAALAASCAMQAKVVYEGPGIHIAEVTNAFGDGGWILRTPARSGYARTLPLPAFDDACPELSIVVHLPAGADPLLDAARATSAEVSCDGEVLARWQDGVFSTSAALWRKTVAAHALRSPGIDQDFLPPHIRLVGMDGTLHQLITAHGTVNAATLNDSEAFLASAAKALPGAGYLDLLGECLFTYVLDSPDPRYPLLVGTDKVQGEIHQTVAQTLATAIGGTCRGDCDDIAELYQEVALRQGKLAHIANLPGHAACFWVDKLEDGRFAAHVLQTGPPMSFVASTVPEALRAAYTQFGIADNFDPDQIAVAIRFNGENQRSTWVLGWRIFTERDYATAMIDVQRDWHFHTFHRAIGKMEAMVAKGDKDPANERELVGLCEATAQWSQAVEHLNKALPHGDPVFALALRMVASLYEAGQKDAAAALVEKLITTDLPAQTETLDLGITSIGFQLANTVLANGHDPALAMRALNSTCSGHMQKLVQQMGAFVNRRRFNAEAWKHDSSIVELRRLLRTYAYVAWGILEVQPSLLADKNVDAVRCSAIVETWLNTIAFRDYDEPAELLERYADAGRHAAIVVGAERFNTQLASVTAPTQLPEQPWARDLLMAQLAKDLPYIRSAPAFFVQQLMNQFAEGATTYDAANVQRYWKGLQSARAAASKLGLESRMMDHSMAVARVIAAMGLRDKAALKDAFAAVTKQNDKHLRDQVVAWIGSNARFFDTQWFGEVLALFDSEIHYKPSYFEIAWKAVQGGAAAHGLMAAALAEKRFGDDPAFREEAECMRLLLAPKKP